VSEDNLLLIFIKNPEPGKVKTRLAATIGNQKAYQIYLNLLKHTLRVAQQLKVNKQVWYSAFINTEDFINEPEFEKKLQQGDNLGERMFHAFADGFDEGCKNIVIIGSDCPDVTPSLLNQAFEELTTHDMVIGPSADGGYYLLGMNKLRADLFSDIDWSTEHVLDQTIAKAESLSLSISFLRELNDIDTIEDLKKARLDNGV